MPPPDPRPPVSPETPEQPEDEKDLMPTERKSMWRTAEERRMSDLTRVVEWLERRQGKKNQSRTTQVCAAHRTDTARVALHAAVAMGKGTERGSGRKKAGGGFVAVVF